MSIYFDIDPDTGLPRFYHEAILGPRALPTWKSEADRKAGKRPVMVPNPDCRIPDAAKEISQEQFDKLMAAQSAGKQIIMRGGKPASAQPARDPAEHVAARRRQRDRLLAASDWTQIPDSPLDETQRAAWRDYRGALRDLDMAADNWPTPPDAEDDEEAE